jgi:isopenicillin-N epimerase
MKSSLRLLQKQFLLDPKFTYLNHGSFGACPHPIFNERKKWQKELEFQPVSFIDKAAQLLEWSREELSKYIICDKDDLVYFPNPTTAMNMVIRSLELRKNDEVLSLRIHD